MLKREPHNTSNTTISSWKSHVTSHMDSCCRNSVWEFSAKISAYGLLQLLLSACLSQHSWWTWQLLSVSLCILSPPFGLMGRWRCEAGDFLRPWCVWACRLRLLTHWFGSDNSFPNHLYYLPYLIQWDVCLKDILIAMWVHTRGWRLFTNKDLKNRPWSKTRVLF